MTAKQTTLDIEQNVDYAHAWAVTHMGVPIDSTWIATAQARPETASQVVLHTFECFTTDEGAVGLVVPAVASAAWTWVGAVFDVLVTKADGSSPIRVAKGRINVGRSITR